MYLNTRNVLGLSALTATAAFSWLWSRQGIENDSRGGSTRSAPLGYYLKDAAILGTDEEGRPLYRIWAGSAEELPDEDRLMLRDVRVEYQPQLDVPWVLRATAGEAPLNETYLDLSGDVELTADSGGRSGPTIIRTGRLRLEPEDFVVQTAEPVTIFIGNRRLDAVGMRIDLKADHMALESNVHGQFLP